MRTAFVGILLVFCSLFMWAESYVSEKEPPPNFFEEKVVTSCVKAMLDGEYLIAQEGLKKSSEGTLEVELEQEDKVYFNLVLKSYVGENEPPLYLRFIKVDQLDIQKVLQYANIGDEIYIEPFSSDGETCIPSHFVIT